MGSATRFLASAAVGSLVVVSASVRVGAQSAERSLMTPVARPASFATGAITGIVQDERGNAIVGVVVSALGATTTVAVTDGTGHFEFGSLSSGPYSIRAHLAGYVAPRAQAVQVNPGARSTPTITLRRVGSAAPLLAAGVAFEAPQDDAVPASPPPDDEQADADSSGGSEIAWRLRHSRRGILKDVTIPDVLLVADDDSGSAGDFFGRAVGSPARAAASFFVDTPFSGQVNLLTAGSFDSPQQLFSSDSSPRNVTYVRVGAPVGDRADWTVRGALTQADISSWIAAGSYRTRAPARHRYDIGLSYSTQRYDGGNLLALRDVTDGSRNAGTAYGYDNFQISPAVMLSYGASYARYDYLNSRSLISPRAELTLMPVSGLRVSATASRQALAPGAEEFLPPGDTGIWLPPQRTFSSLKPGGSFEAERTTHLEAAVERDIAGSTLAFTAFRQHVDDQLVTLFGADIPGQPTAKLGHYVVGNTGDVDASGCTIALRTVVGGRVHGSVEYTLAKAQLEPTGSVRYLILLAPSAVRQTPERIHNLTTTIETTVPETDTQVMVLFRMANAFATARSDRDPTRPTFDGRFDVQVRQSLPFMNFSSARWEMLLAVRNFFREAVAEQSIYDELLVVSPPKQVVGGVALRF